MKIDKKLSRDLSESEVSKNQALAEQANTCVPT
jgi:hypothetical protein